MKILLIGSGGREHALAWKLAQSRLCGKLFIAPGNPGMAKLGTLVPLKANDLPGLRDFALREKVDLTVVGPEEPLCLGLADLLRKDGLAVFGPSAAAARLEGSKEFSKSFMLKHGVATAPAASFDDFDKAMAYLQGRTLPVVVKADGLAAGKGVVVAGTRPQAEEALRSMLVDKAFGAAGTRVLIEDFLEGEEASLLCFCDGNRLVPMVAAQDHKRVGDGDSGPNTGGMGAYSPAPVLGDEAMARVEAEILRPTLAGLKADNLDYRGCLYVGLMISARGPRVVEYNARFGDPETQVVVPRMDFDLAEVMLACAQARLGNLPPLRWKKEAAVCVVLASAGYPAHPETGKPMDGLDQAAALQGICVFHAGTAEKDGRLVTSGGRVLGVTALAADLRQAAQRAYQAVGQIRFQGMHYRRDIAARALGGPVARS